LAGNRRRGRGALPSPRVGRKSRRATDSHRWMAITVCRETSGTELGLQTALLTHPGSAVGFRTHDDSRANRGLEAHCPPASIHTIARDPRPWMRSVLVRAEDVWRGAGVADRGRRLEIAQRDRDLAVRVEAFDVIDPLATDLDVDQPAERAPLDAMRRQVEGVGLRRDYRERERHVAGREPRARIERVTAARVGAGDYIARRVAARRERY
jgi:hypothetical protein